MAPAPYTAEPGNWFLRGVQSAVFYYVSCSPWLGYKHRRKRRREAKEQAQAKAEIVVTQPGIVTQPGPFQTNEAWAEELMLGPGPPKGWKKDTLLQKLQKKVHTEPPTSDTTPAPMETPPPTSEPVQPSARPSTTLTDSPTESSARTSSTADEVEDADASRDKSAAIQERPPRERRLSSAMEDLKHSLRTTLHPPKWNWKRYDREDEILPGFTERVTRIWNRATSGMHHEDPEDQEEGGEPSAHRRKRAPTNESERYDYNRVRHPEVNDLHPPVVSQLPATRAEAAWMLLPPPSAAVMEARRRPAAEPEMRFPLCVIGRPRKQTEPRPTLAKTRSSEQVDMQDLVYSSDAEDEDDGLSSSETQSVHPSIHHGQVQSESDSPARIKHLSDPIIKPPPAVHPVSRIAGDLFVPKRRDSWQFHYVVPSNQPMEW
ncbi:uncharacterized protein Z520_09907 [Fonsecaea multimorphosa CBS 102226]|uniref:Uncharacterized protein n=1 Tax=Fonsecaea multimorphosa CBS 102226 TaxID=1442371 RepID=A0A0D2IBK0_9EURO|nr:uncharacterized protein Z520_09907 [Fonsecaea multimorphosa CBS 102226]KIX94521.1 hypothetical protein Z520_09907 [Fonsecaea multimorphosa CBS 102226]OAL20098.1 hypothetical protein AYO22_09248 [Fonsecaea multimorphosa]